ncbi:MAG: hypothetical protein R6U78_01110 [Bacteroidales bacterium]
MTTEEFVRLHRSWGYNIKKFGDHYFHYRWIRKRFFPLNTSFPPNQVVSVDKKLVRALRWRHLISPVLIHGHKKDIYEYILTADHYDLEQFDRKTRNRIRKSLKTCVFKRPALEELLNEGLSINRQTCKKQKRVDKYLTDEKHWSKCITSICSSDEFIILGAYYEDRMVGYVIAYQLEGTFNLFQALIDRDNSSSTNPMCGLLYTLVNDLIREHGPISISYGIHRFGRPTMPLNRFKLNMLFEACTYSRGQVINPVLLNVIRLVLIIHFRVLRRKTIKKKLLQYFVHLYQGHRLLRSAMHQIVVPEKETETFREQTHFSVSQPAKKTA